MFPKPRIPAALLAVLVLAAALAVPSFAYAGGWVVITLDRLPEPVIAGQPYPIGMMARQHGRTPWQMDELRIQAKQVETGKTLTFTAKPDQTPGHYQAELLFPEPGRWEWGIESGLHPPVQPMPALEVRSAGAGAAAAELPAQGASQRMAVPPPVFGVLALLAFAAGVVVIARSPKQRLALLGSAGLIILSGGLAFAFSQRQTLRRKRCSCHPRSSLMKRPVRGSS